MFNRYNLIEALRWVGYIVAILGIICLAIGIIQTLGQKGHGMDLKYPMATTYIILGIVGIVNSFFIHGLNVIVQAASAYLDEKYPEMEEETTE